MMTSVKGPRAVRSVASAMIASAERAILEARTMSKMSEQCLRDTSYMHFKSGLLAVKSNIFRSSLLASAIHRYVLIAKEDHTRRVSLWVKTTVQKYCSSPNIASTKLTVWSPDTFDAFSPYCETSFRADPDLQRPNIDPVRLHMSRLRKLPSSRAMYLDAPTSLLIGRDQTSRVDILMCVCDSSRYDLQ